MSFKLFHKQQVDNLTSLTLDPFEMLLMHFNPGVAMF